MPRVLVLTAATGGGHLSLAEAVGDLLAPAVDVDIADPTPAVARFHYRLVSRYATSVWAAEYKLMNGPRRAALAHRLWAPRLTRAIGALLNGRRYDLVLTTYSFLSYEADRVIRRLPRPVPLAMLLTDPDALHGSWLAERARATTLAPTREAFRRAQAAGFPADRLVQVGWPVRPQFHEAASTGGAGVPDGDGTAQCRSPRAAALARLGLDPRLLTVFLQGGGEGSAWFARSVEAITSAAPGRVQVVLAPGGNTRVAARYRGVAGVRVIAPTRLIAHYMAAADVVAGKAGPNTLMEATTLGRPFLATTFMPGQEADNLSFITRHGLGWVALSERDQRAVVAGLVADPARLEAMAPGLQRYREWNDGAVASIAPALQTLIAGPSSALNRLAASAAGTAVQTAGTVPPATGARGSGQPQRAEA